MSRDELKTAVREMNEPKGGSGGSRGTRARLESWLRESFLPPALKAAAKKSCSPRPRRGGAVGGAGALKLSELARMSYLSHAPGVCVHSDRGRLSLERVSSESE